MSVKRIGVFTSGGDAPGMNAAIRAVVRTGAHLDLHLYGIMDGYDGMIKGSIKRLERRDVANIIHRGGTLLRTARSEKFRTVEGRKSAYESLMAHDIDGLIAIGGNGTFSGAKKFYEEFNLPIIGVPGTIDNDLFGTDFTIGFDTALNTAIEAVDKIRDTAGSHNRLFFVEVMGRNSGYIALHTAIGSGAGKVIIPEVPFKVNDVVSFLKKEKKRGKLFSIIIVAEGSIDGGAMTLARKVREQFSGFESKVTVIGHLQRGGNPTCKDRILASRLGFASVNALVNDRKNCMVGIVNNEISFVPFSEAIHQNNVPSSQIIELAEILSR